MRKGVEARRTKQKARIERFHELENSLTAQQEEKLDISLQHSRLGKKIIEIEHLRKTFDNKLCIADFSYTVVRGGPHRHHRQQWAGEIHLIKHYRQAYALRQRLCCAGRHRAHWLLYAG